MFKFFKPGDDVPGWLQEVKFRHPPKNPWSFKFTCFCVVYKKGIDLYIRPIIGNGENIMFFDVGHNGPCQINGNPHSKGVVYPKIQPLLTWTHLVIIGLVAGYFL